MDNGGQVVWQIDADSTAFNKKVDEAQARINDLGKSMGDADKRGTSAFASLGGAASALARQIGDVGQALAQISFKTLETGATVAGAAIIALGTKGLQSAGQLQGLQIQMEGLTKSATLGAQAMAASYAYALTAPFQLPEVAATTKELIAFGQTSQEAVGNLKLLGNVSITSGLPLQQLGGIFGQVSAQGILMLGDIRQLTQDGVGILPALQKQLGKTALQVQDMATAGQISFSVFRDALASIVDPTVLDKLTNTLPRQLDRLHGSIRVISDAFVGVGVDTVNGLTVAQNGLSQAAITLVKTLADTLRAPQVTQAVGQVGNALVPLLTAVDKLLLPIIAGFAKLAAGISNMGALALPVLGLMVSAIGGLGAGLPIVGEYFKFFEGPVGILLGLFAAIVAKSPELQKAFKDTFGLLADTFKTLQPAIKQIIDAFAQQATLIGNALAPVVLQLGKAFIAVLQAILPLLPILTGALANALVALIPVLVPILQAIAALANAFNALPTPVKDFVVYAGLIAFGAQKIATALGAAALGSAEAAPVISESLIALATGIVSASEILAAGIEGIAIAAAAIAVLGLGIGVAVAEVGLGLIVFGKGVSAIGNGAADLAKGINVIEKIDLRGLATSIGGIAVAFSGLAPRVLDFAVAAATFPKMGEGLIALAKGATQLGYVQIDTITQKLPALADALKTFQIGFIQSVFSGNILSKFQSMGDALTNIAKVIDLVSNIKIDSEMLKRSLTDLANGLKAFLIPEIQPSWLMHTFGGNVVNPKSVTDYMGTLGNIVKPITDLQALFTAKNFDPKKLDTDLHKLADGLKSFLIGEVKPSWINSVFGGNIIQPRSVTDYMKSLGDIIKPITDLQAIFQAKTFDPKQLETNLKDLAGGLKAFLTNGETQPSWINSVFGGNVVQTTSVTSYMKTLGDIVKPISDLQTIFNAKGFKGAVLERNLKDLATGLKAFTITEVTPSWLQKTFGGGTINTVGILTKLGNFKDLATGLTDLQALFMSKNFDATKSDAFLKGLGQALQAFTVTDISKSVSSILGHDSFSTNTKSILQYFDNFSKMADGLTKLNGLLSTQNFDSGKFISFVSNLGKALQSFTVTNISATVSQFMGQSSSITTSTVGILQYFGNFGVLADGVIKFQTLFANKQFNPTVMVTFLTGLGNALQAFGVTQITQKVNSFLGSSVDQTTYTTVLEHLGNFQNFANGIATLVNTIFSASIKFNVGTFTTALQAIGNVLDSFGQYNTVHKASMLGISQTDTSTYTNTLEHIGNFNDFANGVAVLVNVIAQKTFNVGTFKTAMQGIADALNSFSQEEYTISQSAFFKSNKTTVNYTTTLAHLGDFKNFALGMQIIAGIVTAAGFDPGKFTSALKGIFGSLQSLILEETNISKSGIFSSSSSSVNYSSIISKIGDLKGLAVAIQGLQAAGIGTSAFNGVMFSGAMYYIAQGLKNLLTISQSNFAAIDVGKISALGGAVANIKNVLTGWATAGLPAQAQQITAFFSTLSTGLVSAISGNTQQMYQAGANLILNLTNGIRSGAPAAAAAGASIQSAMWAGIQSHMPDEYMQGVALANNVINGIRSVSVGAAVEAGHSLQSAMWQGIQAHMPDEYFQGVALATQVINGMRAGGAGAAEAGHSLQSAMWLAIQNRMGDEYNQGVALANSLSNGISKGGGGAYGAGASVAQGFANGVQDNVWRINNAMGNLSATAVNKLRSLLGIHSPSTVFADIGDFAMQGLAQGIAGAQNGVIRAATGVVDAVSAVFDKTNATIAPNIAMPGVANNATDLKAMSSAPASFQYNGTQGTTVENHIGTITIASEVDAQNWLQKLTRQDEVTSTGLTSNV